MGKFKMIQIIFHVVLVFFSTFMLINCVGQLIEFISNQGVMGSYGVRYTLLRTKSLTEWTEEEKNYAAHRLLRDMLYLTIFILQHSVMASNYWKYFCSSFNITVSQRLIYIVATCLALNLMMSHWESTPDVFLWEIDTTGSHLLWFFFFLLHAAGWFVLLLQAAVMDPLEMIGVQQVYNYHVNQSEPLRYLPPKLQALYHRMRHAGSLCLWLMLWVHPVMTADRLMAAVILTLYMFLALRPESTDYKFAKTYFVEKTTIEYTYRTSPGHDKKYYSRN